MWPVLCRSVDKLVFVAWRWQGRGKQVYKKLASGPHEEKEYACVKGKAAAN